jgi:hypothetical protein
MKCLLTFAALIVSATPLFAASSQEPMSFWVGFGSRQLTRPPHGGPEVLSVPVMISSNAPHGSQTRYQVTLRYTVSGPNFGCGDEIFVKATFATGVKAAQFQVAYPLPKERMKTPPPEVTYHLHAEIAWVDGITTKTNQKDIGVQMPVGGTPQCVGLTIGTQ